MLYKALHVNQAARQQSHKISDLRLQQKQVNSSLWRCKFRSMGTNASCNKNSYIKWHT